MILNSLYIMHMEAPETSQSSTFNLSSMSKLLSLTTFLPKGLEEPE